MLTISKSAKDNANYIRNKKLLRPSNKDDLIKIIKRYGFDVHITPLDDNITCDNVIKDEEERQSMVIVNNYLRDDQQYFYLAFALGHIIDRTFVGKQTTPWSFCDEDILEPANVYDCYAFCFAQELLIPTEDLEKAMQEKDARIKALARRFYVDLPTIKARLHMWERHKLR